MSAFSYRKFPVYIKALHAYGRFRQIIETMPKGEAHLGDQLARASSSIVLNIAEGAGKFAPADKRRYYRSASGSAYECSAIIDLLELARLIPPHDVLELTEILESVATGLDAMCAALGSRA